MGCQQKVMVVAIAGSQWEIGWLGVNFWTQTSTKIPLESYLQGLSQSKEPTVVRAIPMPHDLHGPIGIIGAKIWGHGECCHGERGPKLLEGRLVAAHDIAVCCGCVLSCDLC
jgi:hypothetical protein